MAWDFWTHGNSRASWLWDLKGAISSQTHKPLIHKSYSPLSHLISQDLPTSSPQIRPLHTSTCGKFNIFNHEYHAGFHQSSRLSWKILMYQLQPLLHSNALPDQVLATKMKGGSMALLGWWVERHLRIPKISAIVALKGSFSDSS